MLILPEVWLAAETLLDNVRHCHVCTAHQEENHS